MPCWARYEDMLADLLDAEPQEHERDAAMEQSSVHEQLLFVAGGVERAAVEGCSSQAACGPSASVSKSPWRCTSCRQGYMEVPGKQSHHALRPCYKLVALHLETHATGRNKCVFSDA